MIFIGLMLVSSLAVALLATRYLAKPLERFAEGARRFGKDFNAARAIVLEQGGSLTLGNRPGGGLQARVTLPLG